MINRTAFLIVLSVLLLIGCTTLKEPIIKKPSRAIRKKVPIKSPTVNKPVRKIIKK